MSPPRYRTLDGEEVELPLAMNEWVLVPRALARFDPELAWTLDYEDAPPDAADPRLDFSAGALLVPVERWNEHAELEPNLAPCHAAPTVFSAGRPGVAEISAIPTGEPREPRERSRRAVRTIAAAAIALLAIGYVFAVAAWLWTLRDGIRRPDVSTASGSPAGRQGRTWAELGVAVSHMTADPVGILRAGLALQLTGFAVLVLLR